MPWWKKTVRSIGKALVVLLVAAFTVIVFFPGLFTKYLQAYANRKYLNPMGLRVSYRGFVGDLFGAIKFSDITIAARNGSFTMRAEDASMSIDFLRLLRRDLSFNEIAVRSLDLELSPVDTPRVLQRVEVERLPWIFVHKLRVEEGTVTQGDRDFWFRITGNLDLTGYISLEDARIDLVHPQLEDTLSFASRQFAFDGQQFAISAGNLHYLGNQLSLDGQIKLIPDLELDIRVKTEQFQRPELLPEWLSCSSLEGSLVGSLDSLSGSLSLGCSARDLPLDATNIDFKLIDEILYIDRGLFARGEQRIDIHGEIDLADRLDPGRGHTDLAASFRNTHLVEFLPDVPPLILDGDAHIRLGWQGSQIDSLQLALALQKLGYQNRVFRSIHGGLEMKDMIWTITDTTHIRYAGSEIQLWGSVDASRELLDLEVYLQTDTLPGLLGSIGWLPLRGQANGQVWASGSWQNPSLTGAVMLYGTGYQRIGLGQAFIQFILDSALTQPTGRLYASTGELDLWGMPLEGGEAEFIFENDTLFASTLRLYRGLEKLDTRGFIALSNPVQLVLDTLTAWRNTEILAGGRIQVVRRGEDVTLSPAELSFAGGQVGLEGTWDSVDDLSLNVQMKQVDLERVLRFLGRPPRFRGIVTGGTLISNREGLLTLDGTLEASRGEIDRIPYTALSTKFSLSDNRLTLERLDLSHDKGRAAVTGVLTYARAESGFGGLGPLDSLNLRGSFDLYQFHDLQPHLPWRFETHGALVGTFTALGPAENPVYTADLSAHNPRFDRLTGDLLTGRLLYNDEQLEFIDLALKTRVGSYSGGGTLPANLNPGAGKLDVIRDAPVDLRFQGTATQFEFLTPYFDDIDSLNGEFDIDLALTGTFARLIRNGRLYTKDGRVELFIMENPIHGVEGEVVLEDNVLRVVELEGRTPRGRRGTKDNSRVAVTGTMDMTRFFKPAFNLQIRGEHAYFAQPLREIEGVGSASFTVTGRDTVYFRGDFVPDPGEGYFRRNFTTPKSYALKKVDTGTIIVYDIHIPFYSGAVVQNGEVNVEIEGEITLTKVGSEDWRYAGNIDIVEGDFIYNQNEFIIEDGWVTLDPSEFNPRYYIQAVTPVELPSPSSQPGSPEVLEFVDVTVIFTGTLKEPEQPRFIDLPAQYTESDFYQLLALGSPAETIDPAATAGMSLTNAILRRFEDNARQVSGLDRFQIQTASARSTIPGPGEVRFHIGKRLSPRLYVGVQADPTLSFNQYQIAYRLNRNISLVGSVDEEGLYQAKFRLKIRY